MDQNLHALCTYESGLAHKTGIPHQLSIFVHDNVGVHVDALVSLTSTEQNVVNGSSHR